jgi:hypothetical protein
VALPLDSLGFPGVSDTFLRSGSSMLTVHFVDDTHLLVTFSLRDLVPRVKGDPSTDDDRLVAAEIVELPSGKITAHTVWHLHDHGRYLWNLGRGRFLVRIGDRLSTMQPEANLGTADPFQRVALPDQQYPPNAVFVSPDGNLITVESQVAYVNPDGRAAALLGDVNADKPLNRTIIRFFRVEKPQDGDTPQERALRITPAGGIVSSEPVILPLDSDGYLGAEETGHNLWSIRFDEFGGKTIEVGRIESPCNPRPQMVSRAEFVAFPCRGSSDSVKIVSYGLDGHETWEEGVGDLGGAVFAFAPAGARFAFSHTTEPSLPVAGVISQADPVPPRQEVRVYQNASGELLLRVECSPVFKTAENFDLSADGLLAAVVRNGTITVYKLPPLQQGDLQDMAEVAKFAPAEAAGPVNLDALVRRLSAPDAGGPASAGTAVASASAPGSASVPGSASASAQPASSLATAAPVSAPNSSAKPTPPGMLPGTAAGPAPAESLAPANAAPPTGVRKPPTLLNPGEKPEFGSANNEQTD